MCVLNQAVIMSFFFLFGGVISDYPKAGNIFHNRLCTSDTAASYFNQAVNSILW